ncbi:MAG: M16 family metallopeptidase [Trueperaceae bacterium]
MEFQKETLSNGLTIIGEHNPRAQSFAAGYFVNTGSRDETPDISGVSHFLEHMMFKGTGKRSPDDINKEFDDMGANYNAYTSEERTVYYGAVLAERAPKLLDLLSDMMRPALRNEDFDMEKNVILEEIAMYDDRPNFKVFDLANEKFFNGHPIGNSVLGTTDSIKNLQREQMNRYFEARYAPNNMVLTLAGNYDWQTIVEQVGNLTETWKPFETSRHYPNLSAKQGSENELEKTLKRVHVAFYAPGVSAQDDLRYAAALLASCIGDGTGSRLYWSLVDKGLVDSASLSHDSSDGVGAFVGYLSTAPEQLEPTIAIFKEELLKVEREGVKADEWQRAQRKFATGLTLRGETPFGRLMSLGSSYLYNKTYHSVQDVVDTIFKTTLEDAGRVLEMKPFSSLYSFTLKP